MADIGIERREATHNLSATSRFARPTDGTSSVRRTRSRGPSTRGGWWRTMYLLTLVSPTAMPSEQFAVNPRCAPERVVPAHRTNQGSDVRRDSRSSQLSPSNLPGPEQAKAHAVPTDHRRRLDNDGARLPIRPSRRQPGPQESIRSRQLRPLHRALQNTELMTKGQNLKLKRRTLAKESQESRRQRHQGGRTWESREERQPSLYQQLRGLRERHRGSGPIRR